MAGFLTSGVGFFGVPITEQRTRGIVWCNDVNDFSKGKRLGGKCVHDEGEGDDGKFDLDRVN